MSKRSRRRNQALALLGAAALAGSMRGPGGTTPMERRDIQKTITNRKPREAIDTGSKTMVGGKIKTVVDRDANPRERKSAIDKAAETNEKMKAKVVKRRKEGRLSPTMPKRENQITDDFGLNIMGGAKAGKMIKARGGGMAIQGMKPTKLY
tara:strand:- start:1119 stop:1571 length:453 start_codon:yes stop_codon:yes gene_type:complete